MRLRFWIPAILWFGFSVAMVFFVDTDRFHSFFDWVKRHPPADKIGHFLLVGLMAFFLEIALLGRKVSALGLRWPIGSAVVALASSAEEVSQLWIGGRYFDVLDLVANLAGTVVFGWLARQLLRGRAPKNT